jgi:uncharacterized protein involved in exopolysaccharide biosynthesis
MRETNFKTPANGQDAYISLRHVATPLFRRKRLLIITFLSIFAAAAVLGLLLLGGYESHTAILVSRERMDPLVTTQSTDQMVMATPPLTDEEVKTGQSGVEQSNSASPKKRTVSYEQEF